MNSLKILEIIRKKKLKSANCLTIKIVVRKINGLLEMRSRRKFHSKRKMKGIYSESFFKKMLRETRAK